MKQRISCVTICVDHLERAVKFYRDGLGLVTEGVVGKEFEHGAVAFFDLQPGLKLALWPRKSLAHDANVQIGPSSPTEFSISHNVQSKLEVSELMKQAIGAGAVELKSANDTFWGGFAGYFQDPDGHIWEIAWNPKWQFED